MIMDKIKMTWVRYKGWPKRKIKNLQIFKNPMVFKVKLTFLMVGFILGLSLELWGLFKLRKDCWYWEPGDVEINVPVQFKQIRLDYLRGDINRWGSRLCSETYEFIGLLLFISTIVNLCVLLPHGARYRIPWWRVVGVINIVLAGVIFAFMCFLTIHLRVKKSDPLYFDGFQPELPGRGQYVMQVGVLCMNLAFLMSLEFKKIKKRIIKK